MMTFEQWLVEEGKAPATIQSYTTDVRQYEVYYEKQGLEEEVHLSRFLFNRYQVYLQKQGYAIATLNKKVNSLKVWNDYLVEIGKMEKVCIHLAKDQITTAQGSEKEVTVLTEEQVEQFLFYLERKQVSLRNKLIGYLLLYTGVRVSELVQVKLQDIDELMSTIQVVGKRQKLREIPLRNEVLTCIKAYLKEERNQHPHRESPYLLLSQRAPKMHRDAVRSWLKQVGETVGFHLHPHLFRHTFATRLLNKGVDLVTVSHLCGHTSVNMTMKFYIHISQKQKKQAIYKVI